MARQPPGQTSTLTSRRLIRPHQRGTTSSLAGCGAANAWKIIKERLDALERACAALGKQAGLGALAPLAGKLHSMSRDIAAHIP